MPKAPRHAYAARLRGQVAPEVREYEIIAPTHRPDLNGEFAGAKVRFRGGKQYVTLTDSQARFYRDQGVLRPVTN